MLNIFNSHTLAVFIYVSIFVFYIAFLQILEVALKRNILRASKFSFRHYYFAMAWVPVSYILMTLLIDQKYALLFLIGGLGGIVGETFISITWDIVFEKPIWNYHDKSVINSYTSWVNFLPWATGAFIFLSIGLSFNFTSGALFKTELPYYVIAFISGTIGFLLALLVIFIQKNNFESLGRFMNFIFTFPLFLIYCIPVFVMYLSLILFSDWKFLILGPLFAVGGNLTEFFYSRYIAGVFGHRLWTYNYLKIDHGHSSFTNLPLWALGGMWFYMLADFIGFI